MTEKNPFLGPAPVVRLKGKSSSTTKGKGKDGRCPTPNAMAREKKGSKGEAANL